MQAAWDFFQKQVLGMGWLNTVIGSFLMSMGVDISGRIGASVQFFMYDMIKILVLLSLLIFIISYIQSHFPPDRDQEDSWTVQGDRRQHRQRALGNANAFLQLLVDSDFHRIHQCRFACGRDFLLLDIFSSRGPGRTGLINQRIWRPHRHSVCHGRVGTGGGRRNVD